MIKLNHIFGALIATSTLLGTQGAQALSGNYTPALAPLGTCTIYAQKYQTGGTGWVGIVTAPPGNTITHYAGGNYIDFWVIHTGPIITEAVLATCLGVATSEVTNLVQNGIASGTGYPTIPDVSLSFDVTVAANGNPAGSYTFTTSSSGFSASAPADTTPPTVGISGQPAQVSGVASFPITITFSEPVVGFTASDITLSNAAVTSMTSVGNVFTANITTTGGGAVNISIPANVTQDAAGNYNLASGAVAITDTTVSQTVSLITNFQTSRANHLLANQIGLSGFLTNGLQGSFDASVTRGQGTISLNTDPNRPIWMQLSASWSTGATSGDSHYAFGTIGSHRTVNENLILGVMLQFDSYKQSVGPADAEGVGWLVGPYFAAQLANQPLFFEGRLLYGKADNKLSPFGGSSDQFDSARILAQFKMQGEFSHKGTQFIPSLKASYTSDKQETYTDGLGNVIQSQTTGLGEVGLGMDFVMPLKSTRADITLNGGLSGIWSHSETTGSSSAQDTDGLRAQIRFGADYLAPNGGLLSIGAFHDGLGQSTYESYGLNVGYGLKF